VNKRNSNPAVSWEIIAKVRPYTVEKMFALPKGKIRNCELPWKKSPKQKIRDL